MTECNQCGECCRYIILGRIIQSPADEKDYLRKRGVLESQGFWLLPFKCPHLNESRAEYLDGKCVAGTTCDIHGSGKPKICAEWTGKRFHNHKLYWIPDRCSMRKR